MRREKGRQRDPVQLLELWPQLRRSWMRMITRPTELDQKKLLQKRGLTRRMKETCLQENFNPTSINLSRRKRKETTWTSVKNCWSRAIDSKWQWSLVWWGCKHAQKVNAIGCSSTTGHGSDKIIRKGFVPVDIGPQETKLKYQDTVCHCKAKRGKEETEKGKDPEEEINFSSFRFFFLVPLLPMMRKRRGRNGNEILGMKSIRRRKHGRRRSFERRSHLIRKRPSLERLILQVRNWIRMRRNSLNPFKNFPKWSLIRKNITITSQKVPCPVQDSMIVSSVRDVMNRFPVTDHTRIPVPIEGKKPKSLLQLTTNTVSVTVPSMLSLHSWKDVMNVATIPGLSLLAPTRERRKEIPVQSFEGNQSSSAQVQMANCGKRHFFQSSWNWSEEKKCQNVLCWMW